MTLAPAARASRTRRHPRLRSFLRVALAFIFVVPAVRGQVVALGDLNTEVNSLGNSRPEQFVALGSWTLFTATDHDHGEELWRTDGTPGGTERVADLAPCPDSSSPRSFAVVGNRLYFVATTPTAGAELWKFDPGGVRVCIRRGRSRGVRA